eukprot:Colp12_sorted_trinity150504_noHs@11804
MCNKLARRKSVEDCSAVVKRRKLSANQRQVFYFRQATWEDLNQDVIRHILSFVDALDLLALAKVNRMLSELIADPAVWWRVHRWLTGLTSTNSYVDPSVDWRALCLAHTCKLQSVECAALNLPVLFPQSSYQLYGCDIFQRAADLGLLLRDTGMYKQSETLLSITLNNTKKDHGEVHERVADAMYNLALARSNSGKNTGEDGSRQLLKEAVLMYKKVFLDNLNLKVASALTHLGDFYYADDQFDDAETQYLEAMHIRQACCPDDQEAISSSHCSLAVMHAVKGQWTQAEEHFQKALALQEQMRGKEHIKVARVLVNLGVVCEVKEELDEAQSLYNRALLIHQKCLGHSHPFTRMVLGKLGGVQSLIEQKHSGQGNEIRNVEEASNSEE